MKKEFALAFNEVLDDKQLPRDVIVGALEAALVSAYRKTVNASAAQQIEARINETTGEMQIYAEKEVVEEVQDQRTEVTLEDARKETPEAQLDDIVMVESTPEDFGRVAAQAARQMIQQRIREAERSAQKDHFSTLEGEIVNGVVQAANPHMITIGLDRKAEGKMPRSQQIPGERFRVHDRVRALLLEVKDTTRGP
jgi:N utilization substance protein A